MGAGNEDDDDDDDEDEDDGEDDDEDGEDDGGGGCQRASALNDVFSIVATLLQPPKVSEVSVATKLDVIMLKPYSVIAMHPETSRHSIGGHTIS